MRRGKIRSAKSEFRNGVSGPDAENERGDGQIAVSASDIFRVAMQQFEMGPVGSPAANHVTDSNKRTL